MNDGVGGLLALVSAVAILGTLWPGQAISSASSSRNKVDPCGERYDKVLARNRYARLEYGADASRGSGYRAAFQLTCAPKTKYVVNLDGAEPSFLGQSVSLNGRWVGYVTESCDNDEDVSDPLCQTHVTVDYVVDHEHYRSSGKFTVAYDPRKQDFLPVPSLRVTSRGAVAFIVCPVPDRDFAKVSSRCKRPGLPNRVYAYPSDSYHRRLLDHGRSIDPDSMRRRGNVISWRHGKRTRHVRLR